MLVKMDTEGKPVKLPLVQIVATVVLTLLVRAWVGGVPGAGALTRGETFVIFFLCLAFMFSATTFVRFFRRRGKTKCHTQVEKSARK